MENTNWSWTDRTLINGLALVSSQVTALVNTISYDILITKLVLMWLNAQNAGTQYALTIKKAQARLSKAIADAGVDESKMNSITLKWYLDLFSNLMSS